MAGKFFLRTFGCQMNEYDSEKIAGVLRESEGLAPAANPDEADVIVFNTCSVREKAQEKVFHDLGRVRHLKQRNPNLIIGVGGCVASQEGAAIVERARDFLTAGVGHDAERAVLRTAFHDRHEGTRAVDARGRQPVELLDFRKGDVDLRGPGAAVRGDQLR